MHYQSPGPIPVPTVYVDQQIKQERVKAVIIAPVWQNQVCYPRGSDQRTNPPPDDTGHPTEHTGRVPPVVDQGPPAWLISGKASAPEDFLKELSESSREATESVTAPSGIAGALHIQFQLL